MEPINLVPVVMTMIINYDYDDFWKTNHYGSDEYYGDNDDDDIRLKMVRERITKIYLCDDKSQ